MDSETIRERIERFKKMGLPTNAGQLNPNPSQPHPSTVANKNVLETLRAIKSGAKRQEYRQTIQKMEQTSSGGNGFQIPETKQKKGPRQKPSVDVKVDSFTPKSSKTSAEALAIEKMFAGNDSDTSTAYSNNGQLMTDTTSDYDINSELKQRLEKKSQNINEQKQKNTIANNIDLDTLEQFIREIAMEVSSKAIKSILKEFLAENKKSKGIEFYNKTKQIVKVNDKLYKLIPVRIKDH